MTGVQLATGFTGLNHLTTTTATSETSTDLMRMLQSSQ